MNATLKRALVFAGIWALTLLLTLPGALPLSSVTSAVPVWIRQVEGTAWNGTARDVRAFGLTFGDVAADLSVLSLLGGDPSLTLDASGSGVSLSGDLAMSGSVADLSATGLPAALLSGDLLDGTVDATGVTIQMEGGRCISASGRLILANRGEGDIACAEGVLSLALAGGGAPIPLTLSSD